VVWIVVYEDGRLPGNAFLDFADGVRVAFFFLLQEGVHESGVRFS